MPENPYFLNNPFQFEFWVQRTYSFLNYNQISKMLSRNSSKQILGETSRKIISTNINITKRSHKKKVIDQLDLRNRSKNMCFKISHLLPKQQQNSKPSCKTTVNRTLQFSPNQKDRFSDFRSHVFFRHTVNKIKTEKTINMSKWTQKQVLYKNSFQKNISERKTAINSLENSFHTPSSSKKNIPFELLVANKQKNMVNITKCSIFNKQKINAQQKITKKNQNGNNCMKKSVNQNKFIPKMFPTPFLMHLKYYKMDAIEQIPKNKVKQIEQKQEGQKNNQICLENNLKETFFCRYNQSKVTQQDIRNYEKRRQDVLKSLKQKDIYRHLWKKLGIKKSQSLLLNLNLPDLQKKFKYSRYRLHQLFANYNTLMQFSEGKVQAFISGFNTFLHISQISIKLWYIDQLVHQFIRRSKSELNQKYQDQPQKRKNLINQISPQIINFYTFVELFNQCQVLLDKQAVMQYLDNLFEAQKGQKQLISYEQIIEQLSKRYKMSKCVQIADLIRQKTCLKSGAKILRKNISFVSYLEKQVFFVARQLYEHQILLQSNQTNSKYSQKNRQKLVFSEKQSSYTE